MSEDIKIIRLHETDSTNLFMHVYNGDEGNMMTVAVAQSQTAGRGQGVNTWESQPGKNLLFSVKLYPKALVASRQYVMLEAGALAVCGTLRRYAGGMTVKWPNDVYWNDSKISGTLSECTIKHGMVGSCIIGTGININQKKFVSDAPNPVSLLQITGRETRLEYVLDGFLKKFREYVKMVDDGEYGKVHDLYRKYLYRREGTYRFTDDGGTFLAEISDVEPGGHIVLRLEDGTLRKYAFKEVAFEI